MTTKTIEHLQNQIEQLVREHLVAQRNLATEAVARAFGAATAPTRVGAPSLSRSKSVVHRRPASEVAVLAEKLYEAVRANPGETMSVIAPVVGESAVALARPMRHLKRAGRIRSAGVTSFTRYFPMTSSKSA